MDVRAWTRREIDIIAQEFHEALSLVPLDDDTRSLIQNNFNIQDVNPLPTPKQLDDAKAVRKWWRYPSSFAAAATTIALTACVVALILSVKPATVFAPLAGLMTIATITLLVLTRYLQNRDVEKYDAAQNAEAKFRSIMRHHLAEYVTTAANRTEELKALREAELAATESKEIVLSDASGRLLVEMSHAEYLRMTVFEDCRDFITSHATSAIGVSGPRGIGKTTLLQQLSNWNQRNDYWHDGRRDLGDYVSVYVAAPVKYSAADFVRTIHRRTAEEILKVQGWEQHPSVFRVFRRRMKLLPLLSIIAMFAAFLLYLFKPKAIPHFDLWVIPAVALAGLGMTIFLVAVARATKLLSPWSDGFAGMEPVDLARAQIHKLNWSTKTQAAKKKGLNFQGFSIEGSNATELSEREVTHLERVDDFSTFTQRYTAIRNPAHGGRSIIIAIDELDKISDAGQAVEVVNSIKDLMHNSGVHFIVSVSEDALSRFELRGVPLRDAFDSTFDTIIRIPRFSVKESAQLLEKRVVGFPMLLAYFCHALSSGIPRDLIRFARNCALLQSRLQSDMPTSEVVAGISKQYALGLLDGAAIRSAGEPGEPVAAIQLAKRSLLRVPDKDLFVALDETVEQLHRDSGVRNLLDSSMRVLPLVLATVSTAGQYFGGRWTVGAWRDEVQAENAERTADEIAVCMADVPADPAHVLVNLVDLRRRLGQRSLNLNSIHPFAVRLKLMHLLSRK
jgi:Cdc6-like AAA superfamily ATPase